jgi:hypothetical protein
MVGVFYSINLLRATVEGEKYLSPLTTLHNFTEPSQPPKLNHNYYKLTQ